MAESVEKIYSTALFQLCAEENMLDIVFGELNDTADILSLPEYKYFCELLASPLISGTDKTKALKSVFEGKISNLSLDFLCVLTEKGRIRYLTAVQNEFRSMYYEERGIMEVEAITSRSLSDALRNKLVNKLQSVSGKKILLTETVDRSILGGIVLKYGNNEIDSSVKSQLDRLKASIDNVIA